MADDEKNIIDEEDAIAQQARASMPVTWKEGVTGQVAARDRLVALPTARQVDVFTRTRVRTCKDCKHFQREHLGAKPGVVRHLIGMLWEEWGKGGEQYLGDRPDKLGRCAMDAETVVGPNSLACDHYKTR